MLYSYTHTATEGVKELKVAEKASVRFLSLYGLHSFAIHNHAEQLKRSLRTSINSLVFRDCTLHKTYNT